MDIFSIICYTKQSKVCQGEFKDFRVIQFSVLNTEVQGVKKRHNELRLNAHSLKMAQL